jgi:hypothetical protein
MTGKKKTLKLRKAAPARSVRGWGGDHGGDGGSNRGGSNRGGSNRGGSNNW